MNVYIRTETLNQRAESIMNDISSCITKISTQCGIHCRDRTHMHTTKAAQSVPPHRSSSSSSCVFIYHTHSYSHALPFFLSKFARHDDDVLPRLMRTLVATRPQEVRARFPADAYTKKGALWINSAQSWHVFNTHSSFSPTRVRFLITSPQREAYH